MGLLTIAGLQCAHYTVIRVSVISIEPNWGEFAQFFDASIDRPVPCQAAACSIAPESAFRPPEREDFTGRHFGLVEASKAARFRGKWSRMPRRPRFRNGSFSDSSRNRYEFMTQTAGYGLCGCRINPHRCLRTSSEIHAAGEREVRVFKGFRCRLNCLTPRPAVVLPKLPCKFEGKVCRVVRADDLIGRYHCENRAIHRGTPPYGCWRYGLPALYSSSRRRILSARDSCCCWARDRALVAVLRASGSLPASA